MARNRPKTTLLVVHCAATLRTQDIGATEINKWHLERGIYSERGLTGYHFVVRRNGLIELGRDLPSIGAHVLGRNDESVGICLVGGANRTGKGEDNFEAIQKVNLTLLLSTLWLIYPGALLAPHSSMAAKDCPSFDLWSWQETVFGENHKDQVLAYLKENP